MMLSVTTFPHDGGGGGGSAAAAVATKANQACYSCRKQKRKCDKALPACGLCSRMSRTCDYSEAQPAPTAEDLAALQLKLAELESRLNITGQGGSDISLNHLGAPSASATHQTHPIQMLSKQPLWQSGPSNFPSSFFLDFRMYQSNGLILPRPTLEIPDDVLQCIGNTEELEQTLSDYYGDIHPWFPVISRKRMLGGFQVWEAGSDIALLVLTMKLITSQPQAGFTAAENYLYTASKRFSSSLENMGTTSLQYLQALILIALYEYGQGMYPAAWFTVSQCVRFADLLGLPYTRDANPVLGPCLTWIEAEERRRVWWAIYILDKLVSLGSYRRPLCPEPLPNDLIPTDDKYWDAEDSSGPVRTVASLDTDIQSTFGRLCQSALFATRTLRHHATVQSSRLTGERLDFKSVVDLVEVARIRCENMGADLTANPAVYFSLIGARCLTFSAVMKILEIHAYDGLAHGGSGPWQEDVVALHMMSSDVMKKAVTRVCDFARDLLTYIALDEDVVKTPPLVLDALYLAAVSCYNGWKEISDPLAKAGLETTRKCLVRLSGRWRLGKEYLDILDTAEMNSILGPNLSKSTTLAGMPLVLPSMSM